MTRASTKKIEGFIKQLPQIEHPCNESSGDDSSKHWLDENPFLIQNKGNFDCKKLSQKIFIDGIENAMKTQFTIQVSQEYFKAEKVRGFIYNTHSRLQAYEGKGLERFTVPKNTVIYFHT